MVREQIVVRGHTGLTAQGHVAYVRIERIGKVSIYKRGNTYALYYRENGQSFRRQIDGNLTTARATASKVNAALEEKRPSPLGFRKTTPQELTDRFLDSVANVQKLALRTQDRYRAALTRFAEFCTTEQITSIDDFGEAEIERLIGWLRKQTRARNGMKNGKRAPYKLGGIKFILSTCRTAFVWASRQRMLPPYAQNPFTNYGVDRLRSSDEEAEPMVFTPKQEQSFFDACNAWQKPFFQILARYGLRVGELTHLLIEDVDFNAGVFHVRSKPEMFWTVKTRRQRLLPLTADMRPVFLKLIGERKSGFVFLNHDYATGQTKPEMNFPTDKALRGHLARLAEDTRSTNPDVTEREQLRAVRMFSRLQGQSAERTIRSEFMKLTKKIGCPEFTRVHDLRHLFSSRAQELGMNPLLVQELLGHATLEMTRRYTHIGIEAKREALLRLSPTSLNNMA